MIYCCVHVVIEVVNHFVEPTREKRVSMSSTDPLEIHVAGDLCLDVAGVPMPPPAADVKLPNNWQLTGETRTQYLPGGVLLLAEWIRAAFPDADVHATQPCLPDALACGKEPGEPLTQEEFLRIAERLSREEIVHSLLGLDFFPASPAAKTNDVLRVDHTHGFSGPEGGSPSLPIQRPKTTGRAPAIIVLDDTGNRFRDTPSHWPESLTHGDGNDQTHVVFKLHRPLPTGPEEPVVGVANEGLSLWETVKNRYPDKRIVIVSIDDLRDLGAPISRGLSWERTSLELVWQLLNVDTFAPLRNCPHLVVRMGLDGAVYLQRNPDSEEASSAPYRAWLIYDPVGIEGTAQSAVEGRMVGYGSAFAASVVKELANSVAGESTSATSCLDFPTTLISGIRSGLVASRRLLRFGFGERSLSEANYPGADLFSAPSDKEYFACQEIPIIPQSRTPDRGYWRLLDSIFRGKTNLLHRAVSLVARGSKPRSVKDQAADDLLKQVPMAVFAKVLRSYDRRETENYRALYSLLLAYLRQHTAPRPLSVAVFGPPGSGKSFGVKMVAKAIEQVGGARPIKTLTFNLSQYHSAEQLADAFHLVRDLALRGKMPLVFFDEFDTSLAGEKLGWLRYLLAPMQDGEFLDRGTPHPIGQAIFVFAGGTSASYAEFAKPFVDKSVSTKLRKEFVAAKGPDFLSRLRGTLDIPGINLHTPFDPYGPVEAFPCEAAILLRRAGILGFQLGEKAPNLRDTNHALRISPTVLRALLHLPQFQHGNRSFEALLDMSQLPGASEFLPATLPASGHVGLHGSPGHLSQLLATHYPFPPKEREQIAKSIHKYYVQERKRDSDHNPNDDSLQDWAQLKPEYRHSNLEQADHIAVKLRAVGLWFRKEIPGTVPSAELNQSLEEHVERLARSEHCRWVAEKRRQGWVSAPSQDREARNDDLRLHNFLFPWDELSEEAKELDRSPARNLPKHLAAAGYVIAES